MKDFNSKSSYRWTVLKLLQKFKFVLDVSFLSVTCVFCCQKSSSPNTFYNTICFLYTPFCLDISPFLVLAVTFTSANTHSHYSLQYFKHFYQYVNFNKPIYSVFCILLQETHCSIWKRFLPIAYVYSVKGKKIGFLAEKKQIRK